MERRNLTELELFQVTVPPKTNSYSPVSHSFLINTLHEKIQGLGLDIQSRWYRTDAGGKKMIGQWQIGMGDEEMRVLIGFKNSYDKSMSLGLAAGASIIVCENGMVSGEVSLIRRHTGSILDELNEKFDKIAKNFQATFAELQRDRDLMKGVILTPRNISEIMGRLYFEEELLTSVQLNIVKDQLENSEWFKGDTSWDLYNHITFALKRTYPEVFIERHVLLHKFFRENVFLV